MPTKKKTQSHARFALPEACRLDFKNIDAEHTVLINILNESLSAFDAGDQVAVAEFEKYFRRLWQEMAAHFRHEEAEMEQVQYPQCLAHKHHHADVLSRLASVRDHAAEAGYVDRHTVEDIFDTILDDMLRADLGFKTFLFQQGIITKRDF
jgi:hemerythrin-like metal-binding protein